MKNRASSHLLIILLLVGLEITGYVGVHRAGLLRGYETSTIGAVSHQYDALGRRTQMTISGETPVSYTYDASSRLRTIVQAPLDPADLQYDALARRTLLRLPNGVSTAYQYDPASRLIGLIYRNATGPLGDLRYSYDANGNRVAVGGSLARSLVPEPVLTARYGAASRQLAFGGKTMSYDDNGNLASVIEDSDSTTFTWDARNRLVGIAGPSTVASFGYDAVGRRAVKTVNGRVTEYLYDGDDVIEELTDGVPLSYLRTLSVDEPLARNVDDYYLADGLGSVTAVTNASADLLTRYLYEPFGRTTVEGVPSGNVFQFTGREADLSDLYYYRARYYNPRIGRFISEDPLQWFGGENFYAYVGNNPATDLDPFGLVVVRVKPPPPPSDPTSVWQWFWYYFFDSFRRSLPMPGPCMVIVPVPTATTFVGQASGPSIRIPPGSTMGPARGNGVIYYTPEGGQIRIMGPTPPGARYPYPNGYLRIQAPNGQYIDPTTAQPGPPSATHCPLLCPNPNQ